MALMSMALVDEFFCFRFETSKRCFSGATFADFTYCADQLMTYWTTSDSLESKLDSPIDLELDFEFCTELKALKLVVEKQNLLERHKMQVDLYLSGGGFLYFNGLFLRFRLVIRQLSSSVSESCLQWIDLNFKVIFILCFLLTRPLDDLHESKK